MRCLKFLSLIIGLSCTIPSLAAETIVYKYDARGRLIEVKRTGVVNNNVQANYTYDKANNRKTVVVTGSSTPSAP
mgnify:CR=1 FL=1